MIALLGDIHGYAGTLRNMAKLAAKKGASVMIQVGDFGVYEGTLANLIDAARQSPIPIYFIDGNHEDYRIIASWPKDEGFGDGLVHLGEKLTYVPRGMVLELDGRRVGFLGGAGSIDYAYQKQGITWFEVEEQIKDIEVDLLVQQGPVDILVTHTPPRDFIDRHFDKTREDAIRARRFFGAADDWFDPSADKVQRAWEALGKPRLFCGHMHASLRDGVIRLLGVEEVAYL